MNHVRRATCYVLFGLALTGGLWAQDSANPPVTITLVRWPFT